MPKRLPGVYKITFIPDGRVYVGGSENPLARWVNHKSGLRNRTHENYKLQNLWNEFGEAGFEFTVIETCTLEKLIQREQYWIDKLRAYPDGLNISPTAGSQEGFHHSEITKQQIGAASKKMFEDPYKRKERSEISKRMWADPKTRKKLETGVARGRGTAASRKKTSEQATRQ